MIRTERFNDTQIECAIRDAELGSPVDSRMLPAMLAKLRADAERDKQDAVEEAASDAYTEGERENAWAVERVDELESELFEMTRERDDLEDERNELAARVEELEAMHAEAVERIASLEDSLADVETALAEAEAAQEAEA